MNRINKDIKDQFEFFKELLKEGKIVINKEIQLQAKKNNIYWLKGSSNLQHATITEDMIFLVERSKRDSKYGIKLQCLTLTKTPFFRFDSDGPAHRNDDPSILLEEQLVSTPHFNSYDINGKSIAYKSEILKKEKEALEIAKDINFGISHFCRETNCKIKDGDFPTITYKSPELDFQQDDFINFDNITFE